MTRQLSDPMGRPGRLEDSKGRLSLLPRLCAAVGIAIGSAVLVGWSLDIPALKSVVPGLISMKPNAALSFVLAGGALLTIGGGRRVNRFAMGLAGSAAMMGALTLLEYVAGMDFGVDQLLAVEPAGTVGTLFPGRMHPTTAFSFLAIGTALVLLALGILTRTAHVLALVAALLAGATMVGYFYGVRTFVGLAAYGQMALHTTFGVLALSVGTFLVRPGPGVRTLLEDDGPGGVMARKLMPVAVLVPIVFNGLSLLAASHGLFERQYDSAIRASCVSAILAGFILRNAESIYRVDRERRRAERERAEGESRYRFMADVMPQIIWTASPDGIIDYHNRRGLDYTGLRFDQINDRGLASIVHPDDIGHAAELWVVAIQTGGVYEAEYRLRRVDGCYRWHLVRAQPMLDEQGQVTRWFGCLTDIHDRKLADERRYRTLVEATTAIAWSIPISGEFESEQPAWSAFTGQGFEQLRGWGWLEAVHPEDRSETARAWSEAVERGSLYQVEHRLRRHDGEYRHMLVRAVPILRADGTVGEWIGVHTDVDDQKRAQEALREAKEAAEAATRAKGEFLANMSHEIRTPMNGVLGMTDLALMTDLTPHQRECLVLVKSSADSLLTVIDDILDFSKIEAGKMDLEAIAFDLRESVADTLHLLASRAHGKGLELACRVAPDVPGSVIGDPGRLRQVLINLVGNAIKFTEQGEVLVSVKVSEGRSLRFEVADTGIGIPEAKRSTIFAAFEQADGSTTRKYGGTGLGLTISHRLVELMGGRIWVEDNPGGGSVFGFTVPLEVDLGPQPEPRPNSSRRLAGLRVLVVDDNRTNRLILEELLGHWGCQTTPAVGGPEALSRMVEAASRGEPFEVVLLDRMMPEMDGAELADRIRRHPDFAGVKMLMLTSGGSDESPRYRELGIGDWLNKPVRSTDLFRALIGLLEPLEFPQTPAGLEARGTGPSPTPRRLRVLLAEDHPVNQKVATRMLVDQGHEVTVVGDGQLAVEAAAKGGFDAILMDIQMPVMDGFEALAAIRSDQRNSGGRVPIVALTAHAMASDRHRCLEAGFDDYVSKPFRASTLQAALARLDDLGAGSRDIEPVEPPEIRPVFNFQSALENMGGDEELLGEVLGMFVKDCPGLVLEVRAAIESGDTDSMARLAHTISGVAGNFAATAIVEPARRLQSMASIGELDGAEAIGLELARAVDRFLEDARALGVGSP